MKINGVYIMEQKELAQRIVAMYHSLKSDQEKEKFILLLKDIINIIEMMNRDEFVKFVDDFEKHLNQIDEIKNGSGIK